MCSFIVKENNILYMRDALFLVIYNFQAAIFLNWQWVGTGILYLDQFN